MLTSPFSCLVFLVTLGVSVDGAYLRLSLHDQSRFFNMWSVKGNPYDICDPVRQVLSKISIGFPIYRANCQAQSSNIVYMDVWTFYPTCFSSMKYEFERMLRSPTFLPDWSSSLITVDHYPGDRLPIKTALVHIKRGKMDTSDGQLIESRIVNLIKTHLNPAPDLVYSVPTTEVYKQEYFAVYIRKPDNTVTASTVGPNGYVAAITGVGPQKIFGHDELTYVAHTPWCPTGTDKQTSVYTVILEGPPQPAWTTKARQKLANMLSETKFSTEDDVHLDADLDDILETQGYLLVSYKVYMPDSEMRPERVKILSSEVEDLRIVRKELTWPNARCKKQPRNFHKLNTRVRIPIKTEEGPHTWRPTPSELKAAVVEARGTFINAIRESRFVEAIDLHRVEDIQADCMGGLFATGTIALRGTPLQSYSRLDLLNLVDSFNKELEGKFQFELEARFTTYSQFFCSNIWQ
ncbi:hypothetical protein CRM22_006324 [Opisthorchis felineus]|uniref:START domain-containing protein n=1 Tax=Opisthorchis felineus TaxID=147828 RepID=A0A4S2LTS6_OPIFE|nr:hypothetical protein CRM22_006324 [Opisthorchis felineus]